MTTQQAIGRPGSLPPQSSALDWRDWAKIGLAAAAAASLAVVIAQAIALAIWPDVSLFKPLESYARSVLFVVVPAIGATVIWAWLVRRSQRPHVTFIALSAVILLVSFIPDFVLPVPHRTLLASSVAAFLHVVAGLATVGVLMAGYAHVSGQGPFFARAGSQARG